MRTIALLFVFAACSPQAVLAPEGMSYPGSPFALDVGQALDEQRPVFTGGGAPTELTLSKALPTGLSFDTTTGSISGTPTVEAAQSNYVIVAGNAAGTASVTIELRVAAAGEAPSMLVYPMTDVSFVKNIAIATLTPSLQGASPLTFTVDPALPAGLTIASGTGAISGTPTASSARTQHTVTATNAKGSTTATLHITITDAATAPVLSGYSTPSAVYPIGVAITPNTPVITGTAPFTFTLDKALPSGLMLGASDGRITGTATAVTAADLYRVTATNPAGSSSFTVTLRVVSGVTFAYPSTVFRFVSPGTSIPPIAPDLLPTGIDALTIAPALPPGLRLDAATGAISGAPGKQSALAETEFTVSARDTATQAVMTATFRLELLDPLSPGRAAGVRQGNGAGPNGPTGTAGIVTNGILIDVIDSFDGLNCMTGGASLAPSTGSIPVGSSIAFRQVNAAFHSWVNSIAQANAPTGDVWPSTPCLLLTNQGSTCVIGVNHGGVTYEYTNTHSGQSCPDPGSVTVAP